MRQMPLGTHLHLFRLAWLLLKQINVNGFNALHLVFHFVRHFVAVMLSVVTLTSKSDCDVCTQDEV